MVHPSHLLVLTLTFFLANAHAHEPREGKILATMGPIIYQTHGPSGVTPPLFGGVGLLVEGDVDHNGGLEIGFFYLPKMYYRKGSDGLSVEKRKRLYISAGYRHWLTPSYSIAGGLFSSYSMGDPQVYSQPPSGEVLETSARSAVNYGLDLSFQWEFLKAGDLFLLLDGRYSLPFGTKGGERANHYGVLLGVKHLIQ